jgi:hypothetical protein
MWDQMEVTELSLKITRRDDLGMWTHLQYGGGESSRSPHALFAINSCSCTSTPTFVHSCNTCRLVTFTILVPLFQIDFSVQQCISRNFEPLSFKHTRHKEKIVL